MFYEMIIYTKIQESTLLIGIFKGTHSKSAATYHL